MIQDLVLKTPKPGQITEAIKTGQSAFSHRVTVVFHNKQAIQDAIEMLQLAMEGEPVAGKYYGHIFRGELVTDAEFDAELDAELDQESAIV